MVHFANEVKTKIIKIDKNYVYFENGFKTSIFDEDWAVGLTIYYNKDNEGIVMEKQTEKERRELQK